MSQSPVSSLNQKIHNIFYEQSLLSPESRVLVAFSGGLDSSVLLDLLVRLRQQTGIKLAAAYIHHGLRNSADEELKFCRDICIKNDVYFSADYVNVQDYSQKENLSIEEAARQLRYQALEKARLNMGAGCIVTAHHRDDVVETFLLHLFKGSGLPGLIGPRLRYGHIIRPLLDISRAELEQYALNRGIVYSNDETNKDNRFDRNMLRIEILPLLKKRFPAADKKIYNLSRIIEQEEEQWEQLLENVISGLNLSTDKILIPASVRAELKPALLARLLVKLAHTIKGPDFFLHQKDISKILGYTDTGQGYIQILCRQDLLISGSYGSICLEKTRENFPCDEIYVKLTDSCSVFYKKNILVFEKQEGRVAGEEGLSFCFQPEIKVRPWKDGDNLEYQTGRHKKLQDWMVDCKIPRPERNNAIVFTTTSDAVIAIWIPGNLSRVAVPFYAEPGKPSIHVRLETSGDKI